MMRELVVAKAIYRFGKLTIMNAFHARKCFRIVIIAYKLIIIFKMLNPSIVLQMGIKFTLDVINAIQASIKLKIILIVILVQISTKAVIFAIHSNA